MKKILGAIGGFFKRIGGFFKKIGEWFKKITKGPKQFMTAGRPLAIVLLTIVAASFLYGALTYELGRILFKPLVYVLTVAAVVLAAELLLLIIRILFAKTKRSRIYFTMALLAVAIVMIGGAQANSVPVSVAIAVLATLAVDLFARSVWGFLKTKRFKQVFGYVCAGLSLAVIVLFAIFLCADNFGEDIVAKYVKEGAADREKASVVAGFDDYSKNGEYTVKTLDYGPSESADIVTDTVDMSSYAERNGITGFIMDRFFENTLEEAPVAGRIWYPEGVSKCPVLFIVHGNHDFDVPSYLGYDYLGEYLASNGYTVVSVDENIVNGLNNENDARALLMLENIKAILKENADEGSAVYDLVDPDRIVIAGHSRGGECVATAYLFNDLEACPDNGMNSFNYHFNISGVIAIAPVCDQYMPADRTVRISDVNYLLLHGANDQDVSEMMGAKQYNNVTFTGDKEAFKSYIYILGANHGQFNTQWGRYDMTGIIGRALNTAHFIEADEQQKIAKVYIRTFLDKTLLNDDTYSDLFYNNKKYLRSLPETVYISDYVDSGFEMMFSFDKDTDIINGDVKDSKVTCYGTDTFRERAKVAFGGVTDGEDYLLEVAWKEESTPSIKFSVPVTNMNDKAFSFAIADFSEDEEREDALYYKVELTDLSGHKVSAEQPFTVYSTLAVKLWKVDAVFGGCTYKHELQRVDLKKDMFAGDATFDYSKVTAVTLSFDGSAEGGVIIDDFGTQSLSLFE